jgi:uncharacterized protein (TIGR03435 family)
MPSRRQFRRSGSRAGQVSADTTLRFDAVSVKLIVPGATLCSIGNRNLDSDRVRYIGVSLKDLTTIAYSLKEYQVIEPDLAE